jgi:hypothetical protein
MFRKKMQCLLNFTHGWIRNKKIALNLQYNIYLMLYPTFLNYAFRACPISPRPLIKKTSGSTDKIQDHKDYPPYHIPHQKHKVSYFTSLTLISKAPTFLTRGGVPGSYDRANQRSTTKTTTTTTTTELSWWNNTRTWLSSRYYTINLAFPLPQ